MNEIISFVSWYFLGVIWYFIGLAILGVFFYKVKSSVSIIEIIAVVLVSVLGPLTSFIVLGYFLDTYGNKHERKTNVLSRRTSSDC